ncbi:hypothetical protein PV326_001580, partial [Microctonus aethiopoides]
TTKIPSHSRYEDATVKLKWQDTQTKQSVNLDAKIMRKRNWKKYVFYENTGMILDGAIKAFSQKIHTIKSNLKKEKTETEKRKHNMKMKQEKELSDSQSILRTSCTNQHDKFANKTLTMRKPKILMDVPVQCSNVNMKKSPTSSTKPSTKRNEAEHKIINNKTGAIKKNNKTMLYEDSDILKDINNINTITNKNDTYDDNGNEYYDDNFVMNDNIFDTHIKKPVTTASSLKFVYDSIKEVKHEIISDKRDNIKRNYKTKLYNNNNILKKANNMNTITNKKYSNDDNGNMYDDENFDMNDRNRRIFSKNIDERNETQSDHSEKENEEEEKEIEEEEEEEEEKEIEEEEKAQKTSMTDNEHLTSKLFFIPN